MRTLSCTPLLCLSLLLPLWACSTGELAANPASLDFGEVDFFEEMPEQGYGAATIALSNYGEKELAVWIPAFDFDHFCLEGFSATEAELQLPAIGADSRYLLTVGVCGYLQDGTESERDTLLQGNIQLYNDGVSSPLSIPWQFTPVKNIPVDTGI